MPVSEEKVRHPIFARFFARLAPMEEKAGQGDHRRELLEGLSGRVVELGAGSGLNFVHYPGSVEEVVAVEPEPYLRAKAEEAARSAPVPVRVIDGVSGALPAADAEFDAGVVSLVLCSVPDQDAALRELRRVIRPGGELRVYEHVLAEEPRLARMQNLVTPIHRRVGGGCHPNRRTAEAVERAGFEWVRKRRFHFAPSLLTRLVSPHLLGVARRPQ
jgi:ubiquinone/menaquinone biosynthesis C-methylase UbiE